MFHLRIHTPLLRFAILGAAFLATSQPAICSSPLDEHVAGLHPTPAQTISRDQLFVLIRFEKTLPPTFDPRTIRLEIDGRDVTPSARRSRFHVSYVFEAAVAAGEHNVSLSLELPEQGPRALAWSFTLADPGAESTMPAPTVGGSQTVRDRLRPRASGKLSPRSQQVDLTGPGQALRQEPSHTDVLELQAILDLPGLRIRPDFRLTSDETRQAQPRDHASLELELGPAKLRLGDANPRYQDLVLSGLRVRGATLDLDLGDWRLAASHGEARRATPNTNPPAARRRLSAFRTERGWNAAGLVIGLTALTARDNAARDNTARDDAGSAASASDTLDNEVFGLDFELRPGAGWRLFGAIGHSDLDGDSRRICRGRQGLGLPTGSRAHPSRRLVPGRGLSNGCRLPLPGATDAACRPAGFSPAGEPPPVRRQAAGERWIPSLPGQSLRPAARHAPP